jgi:hypothetical protein
LKELVGYVHLNPVRARIVTELKELSKYPYCGHSAILGKQIRDFQDVDYVLRLFGSRVSRARRNYQAYVATRIVLGRRPELVGGGLLRSSGGWAGLKALSKARIHQKGDERILGDGDFVTGVLAAQKEQFERRYGLQSQGYDVGRVVAKVARIFEIAPELIFRPSNQPLRAKARSLVCYWAVRELGVSGTKVGRLLSLSQSAVSRSVARGEKLAQGMNLSIAR